MKSQLNFHDQNLIFLCVRGEKEEEEMTDEDENLQGKSNIS